MVIDVDWTEILSGEPVSPRNEGAMHRVFADGQLDETHMLAHAQKWPGVVRTQSKTLIVKILNN